MGFKGDSVGELGMRVKPRLSVLTASHPIFYLCFVFIVLAIVSKFHGEGTNLKGMQNCLIWNFVFTFTWRPISFQAHKAFVGSKFGICIWKDRLSSLRGSSFLANLLICSVSGYLASHANST